MERQCNEREKKGPKAREKLRWHVMPMHFLAFFYLCDTNTIPHASSINPMTFFKFIVIIIIHHFFFF